MWLWPGPSGARWLRHTESDVLALGAGSGWGIFCLLNQELTYLTHDVWGVISLGRWPRWPEAL